MSYKREFSKLIEVPVKVNIHNSNARADDKGNLSCDSGEVVITVGDKSMRYSLWGDGSSHNDSWKELEHVKVNIEVDTDEYDSQVDSCVNNVQLLTGSVVATEAAQVKSISDSSHEIADSIIKGFFKNVQSGISSQVMELSHRVESRLMHLAEQAKELKKKREQMETDYQRTSKRYTKIFDDLNNELKNRVLALDEPVYKFHSHVRQECDRMLNSDFVNVSSVVNDENSMLESQIMSAIVKDRTRDLIANTQNLLMVQKRTDKVISQTVSIPKDNGEEFFLPVFFFENVTDKGVLTKNCVYDNERLSHDVDNVVENDYLSADNSSFAYGEEKHQTLFPYISNMINEVFIGKNTPHDDRVKEMIFKLLKK